MSKERGMMKWLPYKSLSDQERYLEEMEREKQKQPKPILFPEEQENINKRLCGYHGERIRIEYYEDGFIKNIDGIIRRIDPVYKCIYINNECVSFACLVNVVPLE